MRIFVLLAAAGLVSAQAVVEHATTSSAGAAASTGASGAGKAAGGVFGSLSKILEKGSEKGAAGPEKPTQAANAATARPPAEPSKPIDPASVTTGMTRAKLIESLGSPTLTMQKSGGETLWYNTLDGDELEIQIAGGKVASSVLVSQKKRR